LKRTLVIFFLASLMLVFSGVTRAFAAANDSGQQVNRIRVVMTTTSDWSRLTVPAGETIVTSKGSLTAGNPQNTLTDSTSVFIGKNVAGSRASVQYDLLVTPGTATVGTWKIDKGWGETTHVDIYNVNNLGNPVLLASGDDTAPDGNQAQISIGGNAESQNGPLNIGSMGPKHVFAVYYPWYQLDSWTTWPTDPNAIHIDKPVTPYDSASFSDVNGIVNEATSHGIDGFLASWQGTGSTYSDTRFRTLLDVANQRHDFKVAVYLETRVANAKHSWSCLPDSSCKPDPAYLEQWITYIVQNFGTAPSYLKMAKKMPDGTVRQVPVVFIYWAGNTSRDPNINGDLSPDQWKQIFDDLHAKGIDAFYMADSVDPRYLTAFDGLDTYNPSVFTNIPWFMSTNSVATKTYSLMTDPTAQRKLWMGTVVPGEDTTRLNSPGVVVPRNGGDTYRQMWQTVLDNQPDWVMITSWNEYNENTHIEDSVNYGSTYLDITKTFSDQYKSTVTAAPSLSLSQAKTYWANFSDYQSRIITVDLRVDNHGPGSVNALTITGVRGSGGAYGVTKMPLQVGSVADGGNAAFTVQWKVPNGISNFSTSFSGQGLTSDGNSVHYPNN